MTTKIVTFKSVYAMPIVGTIESIEVFDCQVTCAVSSQGLALETVYIPKLSGFVLSEKIGRATRSRFESEAFEHMQDSHFIDQLKC